MKLRTYLIFGAALSLLAACGPRDDGNAADPPSAAAPSGAQVEVTGDMTHAGMMPVIATATETEPGLYQTEDFAFTMAGDWILSAEIELPDGGTSSTEASVSVAAR
jgi:hypothetical protein